MTQVLSWSCHSQDREDHPSFLALCTQQSTSSTGNVKWERIIRAVFNWVSKVISRLLWFCFTRLYDWLAKFAPLSKPMGSQTKTNRAWSHAFSRAWCRLHVFASSSDRLIVLFTSVVIGQRNHFGFGFTTLNWKSLYCVWISLISN